MPTYDRGFQLGLLPEKKWDWRTFATSYGLLTALILLMAILGIMAPDTLITAVNYHVTELIPASFAAGRSRCRSRSRCPCMPSCCRRAGVREAETDRAQGSPRAQAATPGD